MTARLEPGTLGQQIREALKAGRTAEEAVRHVLRPFTEVLAEAGNESLVGYARPAVLSEARRLQRQMTRRQEDRAFGAPEGSRERMFLREIEFRLPDGTAVSWAEATREQHGLRIAWLRTYLATVEEDLARHERAEKLLAERGAEKLADIDGWEDLMGDVPEDDPEDASGPVGE